LQHVAGPAAPKPNVAGPAAPKPDVAGLAAPKPDVAGLAAPTPDVAGPAAPAILRYDNRPPRNRVGDHEVKAGPLTYTADDLNLLLE
jgi:hypothetical protein